MAARNHASYSRCAMTTAQGRPAAASDAHRSSVGASSRGAVVIAIEQHENRAAAGLTPCQFHGPSKRILTARVPVASGEWESPTSDIERLGRRRETPEQHGNGLDLSMPLDDRLNHASDLLEESGLADAA